MLAKQSLCVILFFGFMTPSEFVWATGKPAASDDIEKCYKATHPDVAINYCTQTIESRQLSGKGLAFAFYKRGNAYYGKADHDRAILDYDQASRLYPKHANSLSNRGAAYARKGDYDRAIRDSPAPARLEHRFVFICIPPTPHRRFLAPFI